MIIQHELIKRYEDDPAYTKRVTNKEMHCFSFRTHVVKSEKDKRTVYVTFDFGKLNGVTISQNEVWLPAAFKDEEAAHMGCEFGNAELKKLNDEMIDKGRYITTKDLAKLRKSKAREERG